MHNYISDLLDQLRPVRETERYFSELNRMESSMVADISPYGSAWKEQLQPFREVERHIAEAKQMASGALVDLDLYRSAWNEQRYKINDYIGSGLSGAYNDLKSYVGNSVGVYGRDSLGFYDDVLSSARRMMEPIYGISASIGSDYVQQMQKSAGLLESLNHKVAFINDEYVPLIKNYVANFSVDANVFESQMTLHADLEDDDIVSVEEVAASLDDIRRKFFDDSGVLTKADGERIIEAIKSIKQKSLRWRVLLSLLFVLNTFFVSPMGGSFFHVYFEEKGVRFFEKYIRSHFVNNDYVCVASHDVVVEMWHDGVLSKGVISKGSVVRELEVKKKKVRIESSDGNGNLVQGWALKKYVKPVVPRKKRKPETKRNGVRTNS